MAGSFCYEKSNLRVFAEKVLRFPGEVGVTMWEMGKEDPRRVIHSIKVGLALTLASLLCLLESLSQGIGQNAIWAVMTVVVVLEFTAGATLCKGLNRGVGTLLAGLFALFVEYLTADRPMPRAVVMGWTVFVIGAAATYMRFIPIIKKNYDYGVMIFILTFSLILVSNYRIDNTTKMARDRFYTIAIGCGICLFLSLLVFPTWSGDDLHKSTIAKLEGLAQSVEACVGEYFGDDQMKEIQDELSKDSIDQNCIKVLDSKYTDETMALYASWEPRYRGNCYKSPWQQYVKFGVALRRFGYTIMALHGCLHTEIKTPPSVRALFKDQCTNLAGEVSNVLVELANSMRNRRHFSLEILSAHLHIALQDLNTSLQSQPQILSDSMNRKDSRISHTTSFDANSSPLLESKTARPPEQVHGIQKVLRPQRSKLVIASLEFSEALPISAFASLLVEAVARLDHVIEEAEELGRIAQFKEYKAGEDVVVTLERTKSNFVENHFPPSGTE
ncbi:aluminum-activated malate transporter 12-like isoform X1 [Rhodamnia argentea]|uniref:Aluminum-activated malate transporter 12-like isoform X1 n=1 Tax=Rhodamnia argentea TaxID=178133 RepID=A0ABM3H6P0_9MYRT|nr:aluminum-activated malate transporter 12-like isoform X1 [Rhodamnia argentea]XP_048132263.1 aluminum-activated malate transporter 12-like isoform X1 [Rhodamnia argentea]